MRGRWSAPSHEQSLADLDLRPVAIERLRLIEDELGGVIKPVKITATTGVAPGRFVAVSAEQPLDLRADLRLDRFAIGPVHGQVAADALDEFVRDRAELGVGLYVFSTAASAS